MTPYCSTVVSDSDIARVRALGMGVLVASTRSGFLPTKKLRGIPLAVDNGAFGAWKDGYWFDEFAFLRTLSAVCRAKLKPQWIVAPDLVARGLESLQFSLKWVERMPDAPFALAVQDGMIPEDILPHLNRFKAIFIGGTLEWKWTTAADWIELAHSRGLPCHIGRVGSVEDLHRAEMLGADSCDSSNFNRGSSGGTCGDWDNVRHWRESTPEPDFLSAMGRDEL